MFGLSQGRLFSFWERVHQKTIYYTTYLLTGLEANVGQSLVSCICVYTSKNDFIKAILQHCVKSRLVFVRCSASLKHFDILLLCARKDGDVKWNDETTAVWAQHTCMNLYVHNKHCVRVPMYASWSPGTSFSSICSPHLGRKGNPHWHMRVYMACRHPDALCYTFTHCISHLGGPLRRLCW